jgi:hypothetical protein
VYNAQEFSGGFLSEWGYVNTARMTQSLAAKPNESVPATAGRVAADAVGIYQGAEQIAGGIGLMGGGVTACATGVLCPAGATAVVGGGVIAADGAVVASNAAVSGGTNLSNLVMKASGSDDSSATQRKLIFSDKISKQMPGRGWTQTDIEEVVANPVKTLKNPNITHMVDGNPGNPVTNYYRADGYYVTVDDVTGEIVQISDTTRPWKDQMTNDWVAPIK